MLDLPDANPRLILSTAAPGLMYLSEGPGVLHRSDDGGDTWTRLEAPLPPMPATGVGRSGAICPPLRCRDGARVGRC